VLVQGDSQSGVSALNQMRSSVPMINSALREALELCAALNFDITARWVPRGDNQEADALSREPDASDWGIERELLSQLLDHFGVRISIDLFASDANHVNRLFVTQYYTPGCLAVHALKQDWSQLMSIAGEGVAWVFPPTRCASQALSSVGLFKVSALVCISAKEGSLEQVQLRQLTGLGATVFKGYGIPHAASCCTPSLRVPPGIVNPAFLGLSVNLITW
jgi:hypothetical protein